MKHRKKGTGYLVKRNGVYCIRLMVDGKTRQYSLGTGDIKKARPEAEKKLDEIKKKKNIREVAAELGIEQPVDAVNIPISNIWPLYLKSSSRPDSGDRTLKDYENKIEAFVEWMKDNRPAFVMIRQITKAVADDFLESIWKDGVSERTFNTYLQPLKLVFGEIMEKAGLEINPFSHITLKKVKTHGRRELTEKELKAVIKLLDDEGTAVNGRQEFKTLFTIGIFTGLRLGDAATLAKSSIMLDRKIISLVPRKTEKTEKTVVIPIHPYLFDEIIKAVKRSEDSEYLMPSIASKYLNNPFELSREIADIFTKAGIQTIKSIHGIRRVKNVPEVDFHSLRHSFVSFCASAGIPLSIVQSIVGHSSPAMTKHYAHLGDEPLKNAIAALPAIGDSKPALTAGQSDKEKLQAIQILLKDIELTAREKRILQILEG